jgi:hypothetical protein
VSGSPQREENVIRAAPDWWWKREQAALDVVALPGRIAGTPSR